jgi:hypothetical protein
MRVTLSENKVMVELKGEIDLIDIYNIILYYKNSKGTLIKRILIEKTYRELKWINDITGLSTSIFLVFSTKLEEDIMRDKRNSNEETKILADRYLNELSLTIETYNKINTMVDLKSRSEIKSLIFKEWEEQYRN